MAKTIGIEKLADAIVGELEAYNQEVTEQIKIAAEEVAEVLQPYFADTDLEVLVSVVENYKAIDAWAHTPVMSRPGFEKLQDIMQQAGQLEERVAYDDLVNTEFAERVTAEEA